jgi:hypothetical protein|tara:strand:+ start:961 stop:1245 length:285 start_codon:yes stop_codon:yes gene_type:complete
LDLSAELRLSGEFRCHDDRKLFLKPHLVFANDFDMKFDDLSGLSFEGDIKLPMLSDQPVGLEGFKIGESATIDGNHWTTYHTANVRYGSMWSEP